MEIAQARLFSFSPTGGTQRVAEAFSQALPAAWRPRLEDITLPGVSAELGGDELGAFFFPVYGGRVPGPCLERLGALKGNGTPALVVAAYGNRAVDDALLEMKDALSARGFRTVAAAEIVAPHSLNPKIGEGRPDGKDRQAIAAFAARLAEKLAGGTPAEVEVPGNAPYRPFGGTALKPTAGRSCTGCGRCAAACPAQAISPDRLREVDKGRCISCMRCVRICPVGARSVPLPVRTAVAAALVQKCAGRQEARFYL